MLPSSDTANSQPGQHKNGPSQTFADIFDDYQRRVYNYLLRMTQDRFVAEDLTQETFIRVYRGPPGFREEASLATWVYRIATNVSLDHFRRRSTAQETATYSLDGAETDQEELLADDKAASPEQLAAASQMSICVQDFIWQLPPDYRAALVLHDLQGMKNGDIAEVLDVSLDTVKIRLHRARKKLRGALSIGCDFAHDDRNVLVCEPKVSDADVGE
jgi:RNA polymerase sigma-70 factor (ECF subfamily)